MLPIPADIFTEPTNVAPDDLAKHVREGNNYFLAMIALEIDREVSVIGVGIYINLHVAFTVRFI
jgi:hypothetical protein